jgi:alcohol dehydrogenase, propanol-preferring
MRAWQITEPGPVDGRRIRRVEVDAAELGPHQIRVDVTACGVCRTDLHVVEGDLPVHRPHVTPGHEVVGRVAELGPGASRVEIGERVGVPWLAHTCGNCRFCRRGAENLCAAPAFNGWDRDGGYADEIVCDERYVYRLPEVFSDVEAAPLLCAGIIGFRALRRTSLPRGGRLGIYGFGGSAHLAAQVAIHEGATVHVLTRSVEARALAVELGAASVGDARDAPPEPLDAAILFAPVGDLVPVALEALDRGGVLAIAGIHLTDVPPLDYQRHLFEEREVRSVTANTREDGVEFLRIAAEIPLRPHTVSYPMARADEALVDLAADRINGAAVLLNGP